MSLATVISAGLAQPKDQAALVLMGGGARTAYQAGVLQAIAAMLRVSKPAPLAADSTSALRLDASGQAKDRFPFPLLIGTSAGALNAAYLASRAGLGLAALDALASFWTQLECDDVWQLNLPAWASASRWLTAAALARRARDQGGVLDNMPLVDTLHQSVNLNDIDTALNQQQITALAVTASSYSSGVHWSFCHTRNDARRKPWQRPGRRASFEPVGIDHLVASAAIPFIFPATSLWVDGRHEFFGDGSMRQISPLSPAMHLGASRILVIGVGQPERAGLGASDAPKTIERRPSLGLVAGHAMASVFHDTLMADVEQAQRVTTTIRQLPPEIASVMPYRAVNVMAVSPSQSLDAMATQHIGELPRSARRTLDALGASSGGASLASYLLFSPGFAKALIALGERDAYARKAELLAFLGCEI
jgi:NTE family protein